ncbi:putative MFS-type transporter [Lachnellula subtilissima]|uniref:Putative MFS-type transporter n=1 Tax=Lachnellula subtilissima TaxID=602034 RepID=A0A8H8RVK0_9HELO|nr:putative MFS-type transporter [Lachnellula subtilissima]
MSHVIAIEEPKAPAGLVSLETSLMQDLPPPSVRINTVESRGDAKEVTIRQVGPLVLILTGATFLNTLSLQAVVILLPEMSRDLNIPFTRQQWIVSAYSLTSGSFLLLFGKLGDVYGCFWVTAVSLGTAFSPVEICLYVMRALHGLAAAATIPSAIGILGYTIPPGRVKNYSFAFYSGGAPLGQAMGNIIGGIISQYTSWKVVLFVIAGASCIIGVTAIFAIPKEPGRKEHPEDSPRASGVDWIGAFLFTSGTLLLIISLSEGASQGWKSGFVIGILIASVILLLAFVYWQHYLESKTVKEPLMPVSTFKNSRFTFAMIIVFLFSGGFTNFTLYSTYFYQDYQLLSPLQTMLRFLPLGVVGILTIIASGYLLSRLRGDFILIFGLVSSCIANVLFAVPIPPSTSYFAYGMPSMALAAFGVDTVYTCLGLFTTQALPRKDQAIAGAMFQTVAAMGRAISLPVMAAAQYAVQEKHLKNGRTERFAYLEGLRAAEWVCFGCMVVCLGVTICGLRNIGKIGLLKKLGQVQSASKEKDSEN